MRGCCLPGQLPAVRGPGGGEGGLPQAAPWSPGVAQRRSRGGALVVLVPGGRLFTGGAHPSPAPLHSLCARPSCRPSPGPPALLAGGGGGLASAGGGGSGQRSAVSGLRGSGPPPRARCPRPLPYWRWCAPLRRVARFGGWGSRSGSGGAGPAWGGVPRHCLLPSPPALSAWSGRARSSLAWGLSLQQRRVPLAVAPVGDRVAQSLGEPVVGIRICDAERRPPLQESRPRRPPVGPGCRNHRREDPLVVLWGRSPPRGNLPVPPVPLKENGIEGPVPHPPGGP